MSSTVQSYGRIVASGLRCLRVSARAGDPWTRRSLHTSSRLCSEVAESDASKPPSEKIGKLLDEILSLNMLEVRELTGHLKTKLGVEDMPMGMPMMAQAMAPAAAPAADADAAPEAPKEEEKTIFAVKLISFDQAKKISLIKEVRAITNLGLKESKALVDESPKIIKEGVPKAEAEDIRKRLEELGGGIQLE